ncbi:hypothetical protein GUITHDRAFT_162341 [Guillardia theta CCMP2712]|uniref:Dipeptidylpeptidase IV N-terminal domain-containing protein n=1 Tax=Guillardia theta (strain CCMP2712) TaxID=905079 RepID=L1JLC7_GUITC|nr:hypothetical protein GUITHDRAFT_162341 [Guillardia theta CCMP2712]EKX48895.1 hypothetical protein GUITHDRAFT_162341 [Guillardia theta CCMP2712]|eukprot:XP_005835875.1 hypothetical protein GUITHDRAFT_162341 [Guillardia theta CCMP2712]
MMDSQISNPLLSSFADSLDESLASDADLERGELHPHKPASHPVRRVSALRILCIGLALMVSASLYFAVQFATINVRPCGSTSVNASLPEVRLKRMVLPWFFNWKTAQGVASDAKYLYFSGRNSIRKIKIDRFATTVRNNPSAIPQELVANDYDHLGDISMYNGKIIAPVEDKAWVRPIIVEYDPKNLSAVRSQRVPSQRHLPWAAVKEDVLYSSESPVAREIKRYRWPTLEPLPPIKTNRVMREVQGGCFDKRGSGNLLLSASYADEQGCNMYEYDSKTWKLRIFTIFSKPSLCWIEDNEI